MDVSKFRVGDWVVAGAGATMLVLGLAVPWVAVSYRGQDLGGARTAFDYPLTGGLAWLVVVAAGVVTFLRAAGLLETPVGVPWTRLVVLGTALAVVLLVLRIALGAGDDSRADLGRGPGMTIALLAALTGLVGGWLNHRAEGGTSGDLWSFGRSRPATPHRSTDLPPPSVARDDLPPPPPT